MDLNYKTSISSVKPSAIKIGLSTVYFRKDILFNDETNMWSYQEAEVSLEEYETYLKTSPHMVEDNQLIIMEAIADLYDTIATLMQGGSSL